MLKFLVLVLFSSLAFATVLVDNGQPAKFSSKPASCSDSNRVLVWNSTNVTGTTNMNITGLTLGSWVVESQSSTSIGLINYYYADTYYGSYAHTSFVQESWRCETCPSATPYIVDGQCSATPPPPTCTDTQHYEESNNTCVENTSTPEPEYDGVCPVGWDYEPSTLPFGAETNSDCLLRHKVDYVNMQSFHTVDIIEGDSTDVCCVRYELDNTSPGDDNNTVPTDTTDDNTTEDNNTTDSTSSDSDSDSTSSDSDSNTSGLDLSSLEAKLDKINKDNNLNSDKNHEDLNNLESSFGSKLDKINQDNNLNADAIKNAVNTSSNQNHSDLQDIKDAIRDINISEPTYPPSREFFRPLTDVNGSMTMANNTLNDINASLAREANQSALDRNESAEKLEEAAQSNKEIIALGENAIKSYTDGFESIKELFENMQPPVINTSGSCDLSVTLFDKNVDFAKSFPEMLAIFRPFMMFVLNITFLILLIKFTIYAYNNILKFTFKLFY